MAGLAAGKTPGAPALQAGEALDDKHIVDLLIEERCEHLRASPFWPAMRAFLYPLLRHRDAVRMADAIAELPARGVFDYMSGFLELDVVTHGAEHIPSEGPVIIASTHPTGIPDGIAMYDVVRRVREDLIYFANRDAIRVNPQLADMLIPVEWVAAKRTRERSRETLVSAAAAFEGERCVILFPSGRIAYLDEKGAQTEQPWLASVAIFARKYKCPIVPAHMAARNSPLYYWFWKLNNELRDITLFHELLNKRRKRFEIWFGPAI
ncbi:MAG TPA: 1-acyl-sn-glycerol-3-phosphate acyltransferase, partial [Parvularculaceae bacterium]|nr:1-acyl-sn-glycerol-3-phosphate acyltransferase [Parvularculaceae bacterium]